MVKAVLAAALVAAFAFSALPSGAAQLSSTGVTQSAALPKVQPGWPVPRDQNQIFYLQRSMNPNTVVYRVNFDSAGNINARNPVDVYWRRFNDGGEAKNLKRIEHLAYGIRVKPRGTPGEFNLTLRRLPQFPMVLQQTGPGQATLWATIGGKSVQAIYAYATLTGSGLNQSVSGFSLHGIDPGSGQALSETFSVSGAQIKP